MFIVDYKSMLISQKGFGRYEHDSYNGSENYGL